MRTQIIQAQFVPAIVLITITVLAALNYFHQASNSVKYLALGVMAATGILGTINQYAAIREGDALIADLKKIKSPSALAEKISQSAGLLSLSALAVVGLDLGVFALIVWAVLGK